MEKINSHSEVMIIIINYNNAIDTIEYINSLLQNHIQFAHKFFLYKKVG